MTENDGFKRHVYFVQKFAGYLVAETESDHNLESKTYDTNNTIKTH